MADQRELTAGLRFQMDSAIEQLNKAREGTAGVTAGFQGADAGASAFGSRTAQSAGVAVDGMRRIEQSVQEAGEAIEDVSDQGESVNRSFRAMGTEARTFGSQTAQSAGVAIDSMRHVEQSVKEAGEAIEDVSDRGKSVNQSFQTMGAEARTFSAAVCSSAGTAIQEYNSLSKGIKAGIQGAFGYSSKQVTNFTTKVKTSAVGMKNALKYPIQTLKDKLPKAILEATGTTVQLGESAENAGDKLKEMGKEGESSGNKVKGSVGSALKSFLGFQAGVAIIKTGINAVKKLASSFLNAGIESEKTAAKFGAMFEDKGVQQWADNFASSIHRSQTEVQGFLVSNKSMYQQFGITGKAADDLSKITTSLAYDLGSAFKLEDAEALSVIQDYINGNTKALSEFGIQIDDTILKQTALNMGLGGDIDKLGDAAKAQVRMNALLENSSSIQQQATKKQEGYTNGIKSLKGTFNDFLNNSAAKLEPLFSNLVSTLLDAWPKIEPVLTGIVSGLGEGIGSAMPVITALASSVLPPLIQTLGEVFEATTPIREAIIDLAMTALPPLLEAVSPLIQTFGTLAKTILPPFSRIIGVIATTVVPPLVDIFNVLCKDVIMPLVPFIEKIANAILPALSSGLKLIPPILQIISPVLEKIGSVLSTVVGFLSDIVGWVAGGLGKIFDKIGGFFGGGTKKSNSGDDLPHNANGTNSFQGGWTHINERGGELAFLPSGSTIIPSDKSDKLLNRETNTANSPGQVAASAPIINLHVTIQGNADEKTVDLLKQMLKEEIPEALRQYDEEKYANLAILQG